MITVQEFAKNKYKAIRKEVKDIDEKIEEFKCQLSNFKELFREEKEMFKPYSCKRFINMTNIRQLNGLKFDTNDAEMNAMISQVKSYIRLKQLITKYNTKRRYANKYKKYTRSDIAFIQKNFNLLLSYALLDGYKFCFGLGMGKIFVKEYEVKPKEDGSLRIIWAYSWKLKNQLIKMGITPKSYDNPKGKEWHVYNTDDYGYTFNWKKSMYRNRLVDFYRFKTTCQNNEFDENGRVNMDTLEERVKTKDDILSLNVGNIQKMLLLLKKIPNQNLKYRR